MQTEHERDELDEAYGSLVRSTKQTAANQKAELSTLSQQLAFFESELSESRRVAGEKDRRLREAEERIEDMRSNQVGLPRADTEDGDWKVVRDELSRQAEYLRTLESANAKMTSELSVLRSRHQSIEVLREQKRDLERKLSATDVLRQSVIRLEAEVDAARREREEWFVPFGLSDSISHVNIGLQKPMNRQHHLKLPPLSHEAFQLSGLNTAVSWKNMVLSKPSYGRKSTSSQKQPPSTPNHKQ